MIVPTVHHVLLLVIMASLVAPGWQQRKKNVTSAPGRPCLLAEYTDTAACILHDVHLYCEGGFSSNWIRQAHPQVRHVTVAGWPGECFNVGRLQQFFPELTQVSLLNSTHLNNFRGHFLATSKIERLVFRGLAAMWEVPGDLLAQAPRLREVDLRHNELRHIKARLFRTLPDFTHFYLSANKWDCSDGGLDWLAMERDDGSIKKRIVDYRQLTCHQKLYRGKPLHTVMDIIKTVRLTCPSPCACAMTHVVSNSAGDVIPLITVDCAQRALTAPPIALPPNTTTLRLEGNKLSSIRAILQNPTYRKLADLHLDNNSIPSVKELEGSEWFSAFRVLSLRGNQLKQVPVYAFDKAFKGNNNIMHVFLGHNPWRCDCHYAPRFQALLLKYRRVIRDLPDIRCARSDDAATSYAQISTMSLSHVCSSTHASMSLRPADVASAVLAALLLLLLGKFLYDWRAFKTTGQLPWISSMLP